MKDLLSLSIRAVAPDDDLEALTHLIHAAYAPHAQGGLRYWGTHQSVEDTSKRLAKGFGFVAELQADIVGTVCLYPPDSDSQVPELREPHVWSAGQFCVSPAHKGKGLGRRLHDFAFEFARARGCTKMILNTAQPATGLIAMYESWGYQRIGTCDFRPHTNFLSVLMAKSVARAG